MACNFVLIVYNINSNSICSTCDYGMAFYDPKPLDDTIPISLYI